MEHIKYNGKGEHSVYELEAIIEQRDERIHQLCVEDAGLLAVIRNQMGPVANLVALLKRLYADDCDDKASDYINDELPESVEKAFEAIEWLRDRNNF